MTSDETPAERRLRRVVDIDRHDAAALRSDTLRLDADAIDCGREAIRLLRDLGEHEPSLTWLRQCDALLVRCTEGA